MSTSTNSLTECPRTHQTPTPLLEFLYGSPYYPEHWDAETRKDDPARFAAAGWNAIRMAEFAWDRMEPEEGVFDFALFDETIERFGKVGIRTILCTPTAAPPRWLTLKHPEVLRVDADDHRMQHGSRQHAGFFSPVFIEYSERITSAMAEHFKDNSQILGWQTDNEFYCHIHEDHSPAAQEAFRSFLERRHGTIGYLNEAWGTAFWALTFNDFSEIETPRRGRPTHANPAHLLDYYRFLADGVARFQAAQVKILRQTNASWWITHNGVFRGVDYSGPFGADLDFLGYDHYPHFNRDPQSRYLSSAFSLDYARGFSGNFLILEQQSGPGGQHDYLLDNPEPGEMRRLAWSAIARGADGLLFFRERSCRFGAEQYWCGILDHDNRPRRRYREAAALGKEIADIGKDLLGTSVEIEVGIATNDFESLAGHRSLPLGLPDPKQAAETIHHFFNQRGCAVGCIHPAHSPGALQVAVFPHLGIVDPLWLPQWEAWVRDGGLLILGGRSGIRDLNGNVVAETPPGVLAPLAGVSVTEYGKQNRPDQRPLRFRVVGDDSEVSTEHWYEQLAPADGTQVIATWTDRHLADTPVITRRPHGSGSVLYVGTWLTQPVLDAILPTVKKLVPALAADRCQQRGVEEVVRSGASKRFRFFINHNEGSHTIPLTQPGTDRLRGANVSGTIELAPNGVAIIEEPVPCE